MGVPTFKGNPKASYPLPIPDRIKVKLSAQKAFFVIYGSEVQLVIQKHVNLQHLSFIHGQFHCSEIF
jgi:hypothetical protein